MSQQTILIIRLIKSLDFLLNGASPSSPNDIQPFNCTVRKNPQTVNVASLSNNIFRVFTYFDYVDANKTYNEFIRLWSHDCCQCEQNLKIANHMLSKILKHSVLNTRR